jgi:hypothetical protein
MAMLLESVIIAHGGQQRWNQYRTLTARYQVGGPFWAFKGRLLAPVGTAARRRSVTGWRATTTIGSLDGECSLLEQRARIGSCRQVRVRQARGAGDGAAATARRSGVAGVP